ncbi:glycoside hydrolase family 113 [Pedobacter puniceum]|uniref:Glycoside hydrolase n=1 Tax=Pedobacter puniceum TaxID=2666136 RepID=A0A7K0FJH7_9SPHI|nr:hypothetical protein [Pedobacter puniceum]MRX46058.1 hypothetical protein [Pedobacter puniceum]
MRIGSNKILLVFALLLFSCSQAESQKKDAVWVKDKINGISFVAPPRVVDDTWSKEIKSIHAGWVAIIPYAFSNVNEPAVIYHPERQYWGESLEGVKATIKQAHANGLKVMVKPQVWLQRGAWIGSFDLVTEAQWQQWEQDYEKYILTFAQLAKQEQADMICIGTEYRNAAIKRPKFWLKLIADIRKVYQGKLTYCANWDDYQQITFWQALDFIGISGYFPISEAKEPSVKELVKAWKPYQQELAKFSKEVAKPILFTEYGYRSMEQPAWKSWEAEHQKRNINQQAQANAYEALFLSLWKEPWFAGGFAWKWYSSFRRIDPIQNNDWTPQNKKAQAVIKAYYQKY